MTDRVRPGVLEHPLSAARIERFAADWGSRPEFGEWLRGLVSGERVAGLTGCSGRTAHYICRVRAVRPAVAGR